MSGKDGRIEARRLKGFRDYTPALAAKRNELMDVIRTEAALCAFQAINTPALEYAETLLGQGSEETDKQVYRFKDHGDRDVALRFDLTVPFARFVAEHQGELAFPFKKLQIGDVWRGENTQKGRYREFCQCDLDIIGVDTLAADVEILTVFHRILTRFNFGTFTIAVGNRLVLSALIKKSLGLDSAEQQTSALIALDKLAKVGREKVLALLADVPGANTQGGGALLELLTTKDSAGDTDLTAVERYLAGDEAALGEVKRLRETMATAREIAPKSQGRFVVDLTIARGLGYYTGIVFESTLDDLPGFGSICSGGRYNNLTSRFTTRDLPGVGASVGLDRLLAGLEELGKADAKAQRPVFIAVATQDALSYGFELLGTLRAAGIAADIGLVAKLGNQFKHADRLGCPYVVTVGTDEKNEGRCAVKNMATGDEDKGVKASELAARLGRELAP